MIIAEDGLVQAELDENVKAIYIALYKLKTKDHNTKDNSKKVKTLMSIANLNKYLQIKKRLNVKSDE